MTNDLGKLWAERMTKSERDQSFPDSEPRDAATLMLIDRSGMKPKARLQMSISIERMPEVLAGMRAEFARIVREVAQDDPPRVAKRLHEIADAFEAGTTPGSASP